MFKIDKMSYENGLTNVSPYLKLSVGILGIALALAFDVPAIHLAIFIFYFALIIFVAKINAVRYLKLFRIPLGFILMGVIAMIISFTRNSSELYSHIKLGSIYVGVSRIGIVSAFHVMSRCFAAISAMYFCSLSTPINQLVSVMKKLHVPKAFVEQFILIYRFINLFAEEFEKLNVAVELKHGYINRRVWVRSVSNVAAMLFFCVMGSYKAWTDALELKLFNGEFYY